MKFQIVSKLISFLFLILFCSAKFSLAKNTEAGFEPVCTTCNTDKNTAAPVTVSLQDQASFLKKKLNNSFTCENQSSEDCLLINWLKDKYNEYSKNCRGFFIDENGKLGAFSKSIINLIFDDVKQFGESSVFSKQVPDFEKYCPNFKNFNLMQRAAFHGWIFELTAFPESNCDIKVKANPNAPTTTAVCMFQLEKSPSTRKWRSKGFTPPRCAVSAQEIVKTEGCIGCAFDEYKRKMLQDGTPFGVFNEAGKPIHRSYWASQNPLPKKSLECMEKYNSRKDWLKGCKKLGANVEWLPRVNFFRRLPRFPLCNSN
ncbi:MAG: hypothetical protein ACXVCY_00600 [Pseudobdellovibrionaceae bacterium]